MTTATEAGELVRLTKPIVSRLAARLTGPISDEDAQAIREAITEAQSVAWGHGIKTAIYAAEVKAKRRGVVLHLDDVAKSLGVETED